MQSSNLNKIVALFIVGSALIFLLVMLNRHSILEHVGDLEAFPAGVGVIAIFFLFPLSILAGAVIDGLANATLGRILRRSKESGWVVTVTFKRNSYELHNQWKTKYLDAMEAAGFADLLGGDDYSVSRTSASGHLFYNGQTFAQDWSARHYSTFYLSYNLAFLMLVAMVGGALCDWHSASQFLVYIGVCLVAFWGLCGLAVDRYLYSYTFAYRHGCFDLKMGKAEKSD